MSAAAVPRARTGKLGMGIFLATDAITFAALLAAYVTLRVEAPRAPRPPALAVPGVMTLVLLAANALVFRARRVSSGREAARLLRTAAAGGLLFLAGQVWEWTHLMRGGFVASAGTYPASFFVLTGFHGLHVLAAVVVLLAASLAAARSDTPDSAPLAGMLWTFVDAVWLVLFAAVYLVR